jgi:hypothetical protein
MRQNERLNFAYFLFILLIFFSYLSLTNALPEGPNWLNVTANETRSPNSLYGYNISGATVSTFNMSAQVTTSKWKAVVGWLSGSFTLADASGSKIFDWSLSTFSGQVYATRNSSTVDWTNINCANTTILERENSALNHTNPSDNITKTFSDTTHHAFTVSSTSISADKCPTTNLYVNNATNTTDFEEVALWDGPTEDSYGNLIYATLLESRLTGFDSNKYDFEMILPEVGLAGYTGRTAYYLYVEIA